MTAVSRRSFCVNSENLWLFQQSVRLVRNGRITKPAARLITEVGIKITLKYPEAASFIWASAGHISMQKKYKSRGIQTQTEESCRHSQLPQASLSSAVIHSLQAAQHYHVKQIHTWPVSADCPHRPQPDSFPLSVLSEIHPQKGLFGRYWIFPSDTNGHFSEILTHIHLQSRQSPYIQSAEK